MTGGWEYEEQVTSTETEPVRTRVVQMSGGKPGTAAGLSELTVLLLAPCCPAPQPLAPLGYP